ncbi:MULTISPECIES: LysE family translocator [Providencia]|uniref:LysE family translocator n=1 Tax=Providencia huaxiensis TaxID=2027290 RepID=A0ABU2IXJ6_9GAMM|nr:MULTISPECIES: LysE family translocator [Providencia]MBZ3680518.1 LysE family translocator [Providencia rettgeri]AXH61538.1 LysE family translocator [Providencia huaxiensis]MCD2527804.1 LysE family translocator [Providencia huaxiensis]MCG9534986.1 LysE family translocator [Providencia huaxiensis]MDT0133798.1 LysE family translocator [Providencia huaxiensis]
MNEIIAVATITILAVISPGPDFAMVTRNSYTYGIKTGLLCALGIAIGVQVHVFYTVFGITLVILSSPTLFLIVKLIGVFYLVYIGFKSLTNKVKISSDKTTSKPLSALNAFKNGFLTNALNPKTMFFVVSVYSQVISTQNSIWLNLSYGLFISFAHWLWFSLIAIFFATPVVRNKILNYQFVMDRTIGTLLILLGLSLLFFNVN